MTEFETAVKRLDRFIWYMSHSYVKSVYGMEVEDLHQEGLIKLYDLFTTKRYDTCGEFDAVFQASLRNLFNDLVAKSASTRARLQDIDWEVAAEFYAFDGFLEFFFEQYKDDLYRELSNDAIRFLELLTNPTPPVYRMFHVQRMRREAIKRQGHNVRVPKKITHELVGSVLGFSENKVKRIMREVRQAWQRISKPSKLRLSVAMS